MAALPESGNDNVSLDVVRALQQRGHKSLSPENGSNSPLIPIRPGPNEN